MARDQAGTITRTQLLLAGLRSGPIQRMTRDGTLTALDRGVYLVGPGPAAWWAWAWAAVLLGGPESRLIGRTAAAADGVVARSMPIRLAVPLSSGLASRPWLQVQRERPGVRDGWRGAPARTLPADTILDLCAEADVEAQVVETLTVAAARYASAYQLRRALEKRTRQRHRKLLLELLTEVAEGVRSPLERRWLRDVERPHGLPVPIRQYAVSRSQVADGAYEEFRVLLELDGRRYHDGFRDWRRDNASTARGWITLRYGWHDTVADPCGCAANVAEVLTRQGWDGQLTRCRRCPPQHRGPAGA